MVEKLRNFLRQESEHQWLSLFIFFLFVLGGAFAISATEHYSGGSIDTSEHSHDGLQVLDIVYTENRDLISSTYKADFGYALMWEKSDGESEFLLHPANTGANTHVTFLKQLDNDSIVFSYRDNTLSFAFPNSVEDHYLSTPEDSEFVINDAQVNANGETLLLVYEDGMKTLRGLPSIDSDLTSAMSSSTQDDWISIEHLHGDVWVVLGMHIASGVSNPNSPLTYMTVGFVEWDGTSSTPVMFSKQTFEPSQIHSVHVLDNGSIVASGTTHFLLVDDSAQIHSFELSSSISISDGSSVWFFNDLDSKQVGIFSDDGILHRQLSMKLPLQPSVSGFVDNMIYIHGQDMFGQDIVYQFDTTLDGSIQSGRGFLNASFIFVSSIIFGVMIWNISLVWKKY